MKETDRPVHPGEILRREFIERLGISQYQVAKAINVPPRRINEIVKGIRSITPDTAIRLARYFETAESFWLDLQARYDLDRVRSDIGTDVDRHIKPYEPPKK